MHSSRDARILSALSQVFFVRQTTQRKELERQQMEAEQKRKQELDRKMQMIDALDRFPKALKVGIFLTLYESPLFYSRTHNLCPVFLHRMPSVP
jgi:hypothetical protein